MKIIFTNLLLLVAITGFAQSTKIDLSSILKERRDDISPNNFYIQKDGSFQLMTSKYFYRFNSEGKPMGEPQENEMPKYSTGNSNGGRISYYSEEYDTYYEYYGNGKLFFYRMGEGKTNELIDITFPPLESVSNDLNPDVALRFMDKDHVILAFAFNASSKNSHGASKSVKGKASTFVRVLKVNLETKKVDESYHFIDKIDADPKKFRDIQLNVGIVDENKLTLSAFVGNSTLTGYNMYTSIEGACQVWDISLDSKEETMVSSIPVKSKEGARYASFDLNSNQVSLTWTQEIPKSKAYSLHKETMTLKDGEWITKKVDFPTEIISIMYPGAPLYVLDYKMEDGNNYLCLQGNFAKSRNDKNAQNRVVMFEEDNMDNIVAREMAQDIYFFSFYYMDGEKQKNLALDQQIPEATLTALAAPMLKKTGMNYLYLQNGISARKIGDDFFIIHYDWRAAMGSPDYMIELVTVPLK